MLAPVLQNIGYDHPNSLSKKILNLTEKGLYLHITQSDRVKRDKKR
jgi:hypothetical protein